jgi:hypothetical protein
LAAFRAGAIAVRASMFSLIDPPYFWCEAVSWSMMPGARVASRFSASRRSSNLATASGAVPPATSANRM